MSRDSHALLYKHPLTLRLNQRKTSQTLEENYILSQRVKTKLKLMIREKKTSLRVLLGSLIMAKMMKLY